MTRRIGLFKTLTGCADVSKGGRNMSTRVVDRPPPPSPTNPTDTPPPMPMEPLTVTVCESVHDGNGLCSAARHYTANMLLILVIMAAPHIIGYIAYTAYGRPFTPSDEAIVLMLISSALIAAAVLPKRKSQ